MSKHLKLDITRRYPFKDFVVEIILTFNRETGVHDPSVAVYSGGKRIAQDKCDQVLAEFSTTPEFGALSHLIDEYNKNPLPCD